MNKQDWLQKGRSAIIKLCQLYSAYVAQDRFKNSYLHAVDDEGTPLNIESRLSMSAFIDVELLGAAPTKVAYMFERSPGLEDGDVLAKKLYAYHDEYILGILEGYNQYICDFDAYCKDVCPVCLDEYLDTEYHDNLVKLTQETIGNIRIESRNVDEVRVAHEFRSVTEMLTDWNSEDPSMGDNEILLVTQNGNVLYSSLGRKTERYEDTLRTADLIDWFSPVMYDESTSDVEGDGRYMLISVYERDIDTEKFATLEAAHVQMEKELDESLRGKREDYKQHEDYSLDVAVAWSNIGGNRDWLIIEL